MGDKQYQVPSTSVGSVALATATAGVGAAVAGAVVAGSAKVASQVVKTAVDNGLRTAFTGLVGAATGTSGEEVRNQFFRARSDALLEAKSHAWQAFITSGRQRIREDDDPCGAAEQLRACEATVSRRPEPDPRRHTAAAASGMFQHGPSADADHLACASGPVLGPPISSQAPRRALVEALPAALAIQRQHTLASWCNFQARGELGTHGTGDEAGVDLGDQLGDTSAKGVLGLEVEAPSGQGPVQVVDAEIEGLNESLRGELASRPIGGLGIAITVHGEVNPPAWYESRPADGIIRFGENEAGTRWKRNSRGGDQWLMWKGIGGPVLTGPAGFHPTEAEQQQYIWNGIAQVLDREIKPRSLRSMGVELDG